MAINRVREIRRKEIARMEVNNMLRKYPYECGEAVSRQAIPEKIKQTGHKINERDYKTFMRNAIGTY